MRIVSERVGGYGEGQRELSKKESRQRGNDTKEHGKEGMFTPIPKKNPWVGNNPLRCLIKKRAR